MRVLKNKKVIAREFLIFVGTLGIIMFTISFIFLFNYYQKKQIQANESLIDGKIFNSQANDTNRLKEFYRVMFSNPNTKNTVSESYESFVQVMNDPKECRSLFREVDSSKYIEGLPEDYYDFVIAFHTSIPNDVQNLIQETKIHKRNSFDHPKKLAIKLIIILVIAIYPIRFLIYGIKWSISILKNK